MINKSQSPFYHFSVDDVFTSLIEISDKNIEVFEHPFFAFLKELNDKFNTKVDLYLFYQGEINGKRRTLKEIPNRLKETFEHNSWIRFGPHGLDFDNPPYSQTPEEQEKVFNDIYNEIERFAGNNTSKLLRLHVFSESYELAEYFNDKGVEALLTTDKDEASWRMTEKEKKELKETGFTKFNNLLFARSHLRAENMANENMNPKEVEKYLEDLGHFIFLVHEYEIPRKEVRDITIEVIKRLHERGITSV